MSLSRLSLLILGGNKFAEGPWNIGGSSESMNMVISVILVVMCVKIYSYSCKAGLIQTSGAGDAFLALFINCDF